MARFKCSVLFVDDEPALAQLARGLLSADYDLRCAESAEEAQLLLARQDVDIVISDQQLPGLQGIPFLEWCREHSPRTVRILMTGVYSMEEAVEAINSRPGPAVPVQAVAARTAGRTGPSGRPDLPPRTQPRELARRAAQAQPGAGGARRRPDPRAGAHEPPAGTAQHDAPEDGPDGRADRAAQPPGHGPPRQDGSLAPGPDARPRWPSRWSMRTTSSRSTPGSCCPAATTSWSWLGQTLVNAVRTIDTVGRVGGEEFMVVAPETDHDGAATLAEPHPPDRRGGRDGVQRRADPADGERRHGGGGGGHAGRVRPDAARGVGGPGRGQGRRAGTGAWSSSSRPWTGRRRSEVARSLRDRSSGRGATGLREYGNSTRARGSCPRARFASRRSSCTACSPT